MREILFRGKGTINNEWIYGDLLYYADTAQIWQDSEFGKYTASVVPETLGQYTGLTDKNDVKIFEGDIVEYEAGGKMRIGRVFFSDFRASFSVTAGKNGSARINNDLFNYIQNGNSVTVIGNIYDNPELIGGAEDENS